MTPELPSGRVHVTVTTVQSSEQPVGSVVLVHDLRYLGAREATTRNFLLLSFFVLACGAALITVIAARFAWIDWTEGLRKALSGDAKGAFQPLMRDVRALAERLAQERERVAGVWSPARLRATLRQFLQGERIVILANREPYMHVKTNGGDQGDPSGERPGHRARAGDARVLGRLGRARQRLRRSRDRRHQGPRSRCRPARSPTCCGASGSPRRRRRATTTASPTRGCGRSATSRTRARCSAPRTGPTTSR